MPKSVSNKIDEEDERVHVEYLKYTRECEEKYGKKSIVLMQCGTFFEVYSIMSLSGEYINNKILEFSEICQMNIAAKKNVLDQNGKVMMAGFQTFLLDKYLPILLENGYTVMVYVQEKEPRKDGKYNRVLDKIYSSGTYLNCDTDSSPKITNNIMCIWLHLSKPMNNSTLSKFKDTIIYGVSVINVFTGKSSMFEYRNIFSMNNTTFDELERFVTVHSPSEVIIISPFENADVQKIIQYTGIQSNAIHRIDNRDIMNQKIKNCENQRYIKQILSSFYTEEIYDLCSEFNTNIIATQSFCYLLNFIQEHNSDLVRKIGIPIFSNTSDRMILANHTLMQLNIIDDSKSHGQFSSASSFLNKCYSSIGKRKMHYQITNPTYDEKWLNMEYEMIEQMMNESNYVLIEDIRRLLTKIRDIEKVSRQIVLKKIYPSSIAKLYKSIENVAYINSILVNLNGICKYLCNEFIKDDDEINCNKYIDELCLKIKIFLSEKLIIDSCEKISSITYFDVNIIQRGVCENLDKALDEYSSCNMQFCIIRKYLNELMQNFEKSSDTDYIKIHETEKSGLSLQITSKRSKVLTKLLTEIIASKSSDEIIISNVSIHLNDIKFKSAGSSSVNMDIESPHLYQLNKQMLRLKELINTLISEAYLNVLSEFESLWLCELEKITSFVAKIDVLQCKTYLANKYNYCRPIIDSEAITAYADASDLRHCLIEHLQMNEIYVANDIQIGKEEKGILLFGTNAVGKTSLIKSLGVAVIMAQCGMYVPCSKFIYKPYTAIYSRILGNDNIFKGLSTFAVEMSELRVILKMADCNSLILGDELCSGTETESALSIFTSSLVELSKKGMSYLFATHFHEILKFDEIINLSNMVTKHMEVRYDRENDCLVYDRKLKNGSGPKIYGLEVCKSLFLEDDFLEQAFFIRNKYFPDSRGTLSSPTTSYNANKIKVVMCERCKINKGEEIHHLQQQKDANEKGFIGTFHKNHPANLEYLCKSCHDEIHSEKTIKRTIRKKTTGGYKTI